MDGPVRISFLIVIATGAFAIAILSFTGAVWPYAEPEGAREHLAFANAATFVTFLCALLVFAGGALVSMTSTGGWHGNLTSALSSLVFLVGLVTAGIQVTEAMNAWFVEPARMSDGMIALLRSGMMVAIVWLAGSLGLAGWLAVKKGGTGQAD